MLNGNEETPVPRSVEEYVLQALRSAILQGRLQPGERIRQEEIAESLRVSRIPVREALRVLEAEGHVERLPRRGAFVARLSVEDMREIYNLRRLLEDEAARMGLSNLGPASLEKMETLIQRMDESLAARNLTDFARQNREFHFVVFHAAGSPRLLRFLNHIWDAAARYHTYLLFRKPEGNRLQEQHRRLVDACRKGDVQAFAAIMEEHRQVTMHRVQQGLASDPPQAAAGRRRRRLEL